MANIEGMSVRTVTFEVPCWQTVVSSLFVFLCSPPNSRIETPNNIDMYQMDPSNTGTQVVLQMIRRY